MATLSKKLTADDILDPEPAASPKLSDVSAKLPSMIILGSRTLRKTFFPSAFPSASLNYSRLSTTKIKSALSPCEMLIGFVKESLMSIPSPSAFMTSHSRPRLSASTSGIPMI